MIYFLDLLSVRTYEPKDHVDARLLHQNPDILAFFLRRLYFDGNTFRNFRPLYGRLAAMRMATPLAACNTAQRSRPPRC
jgi:hypothetical protein